MIRKHQLPKCAFQLTLGNPNPKLLFLLRPITTESNTAMNQSRFEAVASSQRQARKKNASEQARIGSGLASHWLRKCGCEFIHPITESNNAKPRQTRDFRHILKRLIQRLRVLLTTIKFHSMHFKTFYTTLVIRNIAQTCDYRRVSKCSSKYYEFLRVMYDDSTIHRFNLPETFLVMIYILYPRLFYHFL